MSTPPAATEDLPPELAALAGHRSDWEALDIHDYRWVIDLSCFCDVGPRTIEVRDDAAVSLQEPSASVTTDPKDLRGALTVDGLFDEAELSLRSDPSLVHIEYDDTYGFPSILDVGEPPNVADASYTIRVTSFTPAEG